MINQLSKIQQHVPYSTSALSNLYNGSPIGARFFALLIRFDRIKQIQANNFSSPNRHQHNKNMLASNFFTGYYKALSVQCRFF